MAQRSLEYIEHHHEGPFESWRAHVGVIFDAIPMASPQNVGQFSGRMYITPFGGIEEAVHDAIRVDHSKSHADSAGGLISVGRYVRGGRMDLAAKTPRHLRGRSLLIYDQSRPNESLHHPSKIQSVYLLKSALGLSDHERVPTLYLLQGTPIADLINAEMDRLFDAFQSRKPIFYEHHFLRFMACIHLALKPDQEDPSVRRRAREALFDLICEFIDTHLKSEDLGPKMILGRFGLSRASLYRMFEPFGGVHTYILHQRLFGAALELSHRATKRGLISAVSERWGFTSYHYFSRAMREFFGSPPSELFENPLTPAKSANRISYLRPYLSQHEDAAAQL